MSEVNEKLVKVKRTKTQTGTQSQITLPREFVEKLGFGDFVFVCLEQNRLIVLPAEIKKREII